MFIVYFFHSASVFAGLFSGSCHYMKQRGGLALWLHFLVVTVGGVQGSNLALCEISVIQSVILTTSKLTMV